MNLTYTSLEKSYNLTLNAIIKSFNQNKLRTLDGERVPFVLEKLSISRLRPNKNWVISGISGSGKTTVIKQLSSAGFNRLPNITTRPIRSEEKVGDYIFINNLTFLKWRKKNLLFHPHKQNNVWHAILKKDLPNFNKKNCYLYLDKSVGSSVKLTTSLPKKVKFTFIYILTPTFKELYRRILNRELKQKHQKEKYLTKKEIFYRFEEEIKDMKKSIKLSYVYVVNDSLKRVKTLLNKTIAASKKL